MYYQLGFLDIMAQNIATFLILALSLLFGSILLLIWRKRRKKEDRAPAIFVGAITLFIVIIATLTMISEIDSGWTLNNDQLVIKAYDTKSIPLSDAKIALIDSQGEWEIAQKIKGHGITQDLNFGTFILKNGKKALVFQHFAAPKMLLLVADNQYFILSTPSIDKLYDELIKRGTAKLNE